MLESIFVISICAGFIFFILSLEEENIVYSFISLLMWLIIMGGFLAVEVPSDTYYAEWAYFAVSLGFIFINISWEIILYMDLDYWRKRNF